MRPSGLIVAPRGVREDFSLRSLNSEDAASWNPTGRVKIPFVYWPSRPMEGSRMTLRPGIAVAPHSGRALPGWAKLGPGLAICIAIAAVALLAGQEFPLIGAPLFAIAIGVAITNTLPGTVRVSTLKIGDIAKLCL